MTDSLFARVLDKPDQTAGLRYADGRAWRAATAHPCPWCHAPFFLRCGHGCPLESAAADDVIAAYDAQSSAADEAARQRALLRAIGKISRLREPLTAALAASVHRLGLTATIDDARIIAATTILRAAGELSMDTAAGDSLLTLFSFPAA